MEAPKGPWQKMSGNITNIESLPFWKLHGFSANIESSQKKPAYITANIDASRVQDPNCVRMATSYRNSRSAATPVLGRELQRYGLYDILHMCKVKVKKHPPTRKVH